MFGLFESVLENGNPELLQELSTGVSKKWKELQVDELYESWLEEITELITRLHTTMTAGGDAKAELVADFNDEEHQRSYIYFLRVRYSVHSLLLS